MGVGGRGGVGNELIDRHFSVAATFRQRGAIQFIEISSKNK